MRGTGRALSEQAASGRAARDGNGVAAQEFGRERVVEIQRARILAATVEVCAELDVGRVTVAHIVERAGVSRRTFYELYSGCEDCFLGAFDDGIARASRYVLEAYDPSAGWAERIRAALTGLLSFLDVERGAGQLLVVGSLGAGAGALERRQRVLAQMITVVDEGRREAKQGSELPSLTAEGVVGAVFSVIHARMVAGERRPFTELVNPLMGMIVLPYLGPAAARRELHRPVAKGSGRKGAGLSARVSGDPLRDLRMRLTYRTIRVLLALAEQPAASNRRVGEVAGMADQGQISKLLGRLAGLGLVENRGGPSGSGAPNAWVLTDRGRAFDRIVRERAGG